MLADDEDSADLNPMRQAFVDPPHPYPIIVMSLPPKLHAYGSFGSGSATLARSRDGTYVEIFEWRSHGAKEAAHQHPSVAAIWEAMAEIADLLPLASLAEAQAPFPNFSVLNAGNAKP